METTLSKTKNMRSREFVTNLKSSNKEINQLSEVSMAPSDLRKFASTNEADGILAGFEAELIFSNLGTGGPDDDEEDMSYDTRPDSIDEVIDFFSVDDYGHGMSVSRANRLRQQLDDLYSDWVEEQMLDDWQNDSEDLISSAWLDERPMDERIHDALTDGMGLTDDEADAVIILHARRERGEIKGSEMSEEELEMESKYSEARSIAMDILEEDVQGSIDNQDGIYDQALDDYRDDYTISNEDRFFSDNGMRYMSDIADNYSLSWPYWTYNGGDDEGDHWDISDARNLATDLKVTLGVETKVGNGYRSVRRDDVTWIIERDGSLQPSSTNDMAVEIISPPMPLLDCLQKMEKFFDWAKDNDAYANQSTGFHMGVSLPYRGGDVDYLKLALFLGDQYVLNEFGREANDTCSSALEKIRLKIGNNVDKTVSDTMALMKGNLLELAHRSLRIQNSGFGKYTSINPKRDDLGKRLKYIEFRSAGNEDYFKDISKLKNTLLRYAQAMQIAGDPAAYRNEYAKKLYKLINPNPTAQDPVVALFSQYATGAITAGELKTQWADLELIRDPQLTSNRAKLANRIQTTAQQRDQQDTNRYYWYAETARIPRDWEFYHAVGGNAVLDRVSNINMIQANSVRADVARRYQLPDHEIRMRSVPTTASAERARAGSQSVDPGVHDVDFNIAQNFSNPTNENFKDRIKSGPLFEPLSRSSVTKTLGESLFDLLIDIELGEWTLTENTGPVQFVRSKIFDETLAKKARQAPNAEDKLQEFIEYKTINPLQPWGSKDKPFPADGPIGRTFPKLRYAHLTSDIILFYSMEGRDPIMFKLYGVFSHDDIGIGMPRNINKQKSFVKRLSGQNDMMENFKDGKGPGQAGDSQRHGIPKHATMAELERASHSKGRKGQLARWQLNMRRGHKK